MIEPAKRHPVIPVLKACTLPLSVFFGFVGGGFLGALFGVAGMGAAVGVGIGIGVGVGLTALYVVIFFESEG